MRWFEKLYLKLFGVKCLVCDGSGRVPIWCDGSGRVQIWYGSGRVPSWYGYTIICWRCQGVGKIKEY